MLTPVRSASQRLARALLRWSGWRLVGEAPPIPRCVTGAIPVDRREHHALVRRLAVAFRERDELWLAMSPEGTRAKTDHWKSGFYHVARVDERQQQRDAGVAGEVRLREGGAD